MAGDGSLPAAAEAEGSATRGNGGGEPDFDAGGMEPGGRTAGGGGGGGSAELEDETAGGGASGTGPGLVGVPGEAVRNRSFSLGVSLSAGDVSGAGGLAAEGGLGREAGSEEAGAAVGSDSGAERRGLRRTGGDGISLAGGGETGDSVAGPEVSEMSLGLRRRRGVDGSAAGVAGSEVVGSVDSAESGFARGLRRNG